MSNVYTPYYSIRGRKDSVAVLDIGSSKIACFIAEKNEQGAFAITGIGHHHARGLRAGTVTDSHAAETSIAGAVHLAEQMAGATIENVMVNLSLPDIRSHIVHVDLNITGGAVNDQDISDIIHEGAQSVMKEGRRILHCFVTQYQLDGAKGIRDPRNMYGMTLKAEIHIVSVDERKLINLANTVSRCHLDISEFVAAPYTAGLGCLQPDEKELGVTVIDMGTSSTGISIFQGAANYFNSIIPIGAGHVTTDLAQGLSTSISNAERIKTLHGSVLSTTNDDQQMIAIPPIGEDMDAEETSVTRTAIVNIIHPRIEETLELVYDRIEQHGMLQQMGRHIVLTGGGSQLVGVRELATGIFSKQVRIGKPQLFPGLAESVSGPGFTAAVGMLLFVEERPFEDTLIRKLHAPSHFPSLGLAKLGAWLKSRF